MTTQSPVMPVSVRIWWISSAARRSKGDSIVVRPTHLCRVEGYRVVSSGIFEITPICNVFLSQKI
jgi:hypothetical protein